MCMEHKGGTDSHSLLFSDSKAMFVWPSKVQADQRHTSDTEASVTGKPGRAMGTLELRGQPFYCFHVTV